MCLPSSRADLFWGGRARVMNQLAVTGAGRVVATHTHTTTSALFGPLFAGLLFSKPVLIHYPFRIGGALKIDYDLLYRAFV
jgi:hypothetical protein